MDVASENLPTVLMVTEGKPRPALFCEIIVRLHDAEDIEDKENLATVLELTVGKPKPDIFYQTVERMDDVKESEKQDVPAVYSIAVCPRTSTECCRVLFVNQAYETEGPLEAVALCFCLAWVFNLQYFVKYLRAFVCFERLVGLKHSTLCCVGTRLLTSLK
ncbi:unnamed protein product [Ixodes persulcatus]